MTEDVVIIIGGGVGPMAGVALHAKIVEQTLTDGTDQGHFTVFHHSCSSAVPDRSAYLAVLEASGESGAHDLDNPGEAMAAVFEQAAKALSGRRAVGGVPCNTFHAPPIYKSFVRAMEEKRTPVRLVHMLEETIGLLGRRLGKENVWGKPGGETIGILCTEGARRSRVYDRLLEKNGYRPLYLSPDDHARVHEAVYDRSWGLKALSPVGERAVEVVSSMTARLAQAGAAAVILGCTELPLALPGEAYQGTPLVDPVSALARALIREADAKRLKPQGEAF